MFAGACDLKAITEVCSGDGIESDEIFALVASLVCESILVREDQGKQGRYRLLETIREFGNDVLVRSGEYAAVRARHFECYRRLTQEAGNHWFCPHQAESLGRMHLEQPNLRTALEYSLTEPGQEKAGLEVAAILHILWVINGSLREGCRWLKRALALNPEPTRFRAMALHGYVFLKITLGDIEGALSLLRECRVLGERLGDAPALAYAALREGSAKMYQGDVSRAFVLLEDALTRMRNLDDPFGVYFALRYLSMTARPLGILEVRRSGMSVSPNARPTIPACLDHGRCGWSAWRTGGKAM